MCKLVSNYKPSRRSSQKSYSKLLRRLHETEFVYILDMDGNRAEDGIDLRYRFGFENSYEDAMIASYLDVRPCSVLEMMVALALRCEEHIMGEPDSDRTNVWFWNMIASLHLRNMNDDNYNERYVDTALSKFVNRQYDKDGSGGLFTVEDTNRDMRGVEIWYQMCLYLDRYY